MIINKDQLIEKILHHGFKIARIYDGYVTPQSLKNEHTPYFQLYDEKSPEELVASIEKFSQNYPGNFTISLRTSSGGYNSSVLSVRFDQMHNQNLQLNGMSQQVPFETPDQMEKRLLDKIRKEMEVDLLKNENRALKAQLQGNETLAGKLGQIAEMWIRGKMGEKIPSMQNNATMNGAESETNSENISQEQIQNALAKLLELFGAETLIKLSHKVNEGDPMILMVKNYANS